jgi:hypothetical protein
MKGHSCQEFKQRNSVVTAYVAQWPEIGHNSGKLLLGNGLAIPPEAFPEGVQVRRRIESSAKARSVKGRVAQGSGTPLALGAGYVDGGHAAMGTTRTIEKFLHPAKVVYCLLPGAIDPGSLGIEQGEHVCYGFLVIQRTPPRYFLTLSYFHPDNYLFTEGQRLPDM